MNVFILELGFDGLEAWIDSVAGMSRAGVYKYMALIESLPHIPVSELDKMQLHECGSTFTSTGSQAKGFCMDRESSDAKPERDAGCGELDAWSLAHRNLLSEDHV
jgi:hypothetical protein